MDAQSAPEPQAIVLPSTPRVGRVPDHAARPRVMSWFMASFLHVAVAVLLVMQM